jgi:hypothetical protein
VNGEPSTEGKTLMPVLQNAPAYVECQIYQIVNDGGDHAVVIYGGGGDRMPHTGSTFDHRRIAVGRRWLRVHRHHYCIDSLKNLINVIL